MQPNFSAEDNAFRREVRDFVEAHLPDDLARRGRYDYHPRRDDQVREERQQRAVLDHQYCTFFSTKRNCTTVSAITIAISTTDCAADPPRSSPLKPSW